MGVAFVTGMQGDDPHYYRVISTPKHFAVHSGPEPTRHSADVTVSKHDELDTYLPAFRATVTEGKADSVMCAYNSINGAAGLRQRVPACRISCAASGASRATWSPTAARSSTSSTGHHFKPTQPEASAISLQRGMDNECIDFSAKVTTTTTTSPISTRCKQGYLKESEIDTALMRLFTARMKLGMFDPPEMVPYTKIDEKLLDSAAASRAGAQARQRVDGAAEERRRAAAEDHGHQDCRRRSAGRSDQGAAGQLQRHSDAHGFDSRRA